MESPFTILVPVADPKLVVGLLRIAGALLGGRRGRIIVLGVVEVPPEHSLAEGAHLARQERRLLAEVAQADALRGLDVESRVRVAHQAWDGIVETVAEEGVDLLLLGWESWPHRDEPAYGTTTDTLVKEPSCNVAVLRPGSRGEIRRILVPIRGGPHAELALSLASALATWFAAAVTLLHVERPDASWRERQIEERLFTALAAQVGAHWVVRRVVATGSVTATILEAARDHDLVVMGASAIDDGSLLGVVPERIAAAADAAVLAVRTATPVDPSLFAAPSEPFHWTVDRWFGESTFHAREFADIAELVAIKERQGLTVSLGLVARDVAATLPSVARVMMSELMDRFPLLDEVAVIDYGSTDATIEVATAQGLRVCRSQDILPQYGYHGDRGAALWKSLFVLRGDIIVWLEPDIMNPHPKFVYGLVGALLREPRVRYVKGFHRQRVRVGGVAYQVGGGRVDELTARPLLNLYFPELSGVVHPTSREHAGWRRVLAQAPFFSGAGVEVGLLIDIADRFGLPTIGQVDLEERVRRREDTFDLRAQATAVAQVVGRRIEGRQRVRLVEETRLNLIRAEGDRFYLEMKEVEETELPPAVSVAEYGAAMRPAAT